MDHWNPGRTGVRGTTRRSRSCLDSAAESSEALRSSPQHDPGVATDTSPGQHDFNDNDHDDTATNDDNYVAATNDVDDYHHLASDDHIQYVHHDDDGALQL